MPSKISIHLSAYPNRTYDILQKMQPGVVKVYNYSSEANVDEIRRRCPNVIVVYRQYSNLDYHTSADAFFAEIGDTLRKMRGRGILWEGINEPIVHSIDDAKALNAWYLQFAQLMHGQGEQVAGFCWSTGNPTADMLNQIIPYLTEAAAAADVHAFHEFYSTVNRQNDWGGYRAFEQALPLTARRPVVITEAGLDDNGDPRTGGWRGKKSPQEYLDILKAYDALLLQDAYVLGATVYQWGDGAWPSFELDSMVGILSDYVASVGGGLVTPKPWPVLSPPPAPNFSFSISPDTIDPGQSATLKWDVNGVSAIYLDGVGVTGHETRIVSPAQTTTYTLHIFFVDGTSQDLTETVTVEGMPPIPIALFSVTPETIQVGSPATLRWTSQLAVLVTLDGQTVAASGFQIVTPTQATTYALHVVFSDDTVQDLTVTLMVVPKTHGILPRPPSIVLTPENTAHLSTFPRPTQDNGRGLHFDLDLRDPSISRTVTNLQAIHCKWTLIYAQDELQAGRAAKACWEAGILPVVRIGKKVDEAFDPIPYVNALTSIGAPPYVQIYNEPGDNREWNQFPPPDQDLKSIFAARWRQKASLVYQAGGYPGIQCLDPSELQAAVDSTGKDHPLWQKAFFVQHNYGANHPPAYPYDARSQQDHPGRTIFDDNVGVLAFLDIAHWMMEFLGFVIPIIGGEGGWEYGADQDAHYPAVAQPYHARYHTEMFDWFRTGRLSNGEPLPDYVFSITPWIAGGWGADDWWGGTLGDKTATTNAVAAIPSFVRQFSWDGGVPPAPGVSFAATPASIYSGTSSTLEWHVDEASEVSLDGSGVAAHGTKVVSLIQTTTFNLHIVFLDHATQDLSVTVAVTTAPPPPGVQWDPHLDDLGVRLKLVDAPNAWRITAAALQDPGQSSDNHHVYIKATQTDGTPAVGVKFVVDWVGRDPEDSPAIVTTDRSGEARCPLWATMNPNLKNGIYFAMPKDQPGDRVMGMGLPNARPVNFLLTFRYS